MKYSPDEGYMMVPDAARWAVEYRGLPLNDDEIGRQYRLIHTWKRAGQIRWKPYGKTLFQIEKQSLKERIDYVPPSNQPIMAVVNVPELAKESTPLADVLKLFEQGILSREAAHEAIERIYK